MIEAVAGVVLGEVGGGGEIHAQDVTDGIGVFITTQTADDDAAGVGTFGVDGMQGVIEPAHKVGAGRRGGLGMLGGGHETELHVLEDAFPCLAIFSHGGGCGKGFQREGALSGGVVMALQAVAGDEGLDGLVKGKLRCGRTQVPVPPRPSLPGGCAEKNDAGGGGYCRGRTHGRGGVFQGNSENGELSRVMEGFPR